MHVVIAKEHNVTALAFVAVPGRVFGGIETSIFPDPIARDDFGHWTDGDFRGFDGSAARLIGDMFHSPRVRRTLCTVAVAVFTEAIFGAVVWVALV